MQTISVQLSQPDITDTIMHFIAQHGYSHCESSDNADLLITDASCNAYQHANCPAIILAYDTQKSDLGDIPASIIITLPTQLSTILYHIKQASKRHHISAIALEGGWVFVPIMHHITHPSQAAPIILTEKESTLLVTLCMNPGKSIDKQQLLHDVWGYGNTTSTHTLETHMYRLRQKLAECSCDSLIETTEHGYQIILR